MTSLNTDFDALIAQKQWGPLAKEFSTSSFEKIYQCFEKYLAKVDDSKKACNLALKTFSAIPSEHLRDENKLAALAHTLATSKLVNLKDKAILKWFSEICWKAPNLANVLTEHAPHLLTAQDEEGRNALHYALESFTSVELITKLLDGRPELLEEADEDGLTPLHSLISLGRWDCASLFLDLHPDLSAPVHLRELFQSGNLSEASYEIVLEMIDFFFPEDEGEDAGLPPITLGTALLYTFCEAKPPKVDLSEGPYQLQMHHFAEWFPDQLYEEEGEMMLEDDGQNQPPLIAGDDGQMEIEIEEEDHHEMADSFEDVQFMQIGLAETLAQVLAEGEDEEQMEEAELGQLKEKVLELIFKQRNQFESREWTHILATLSEAADLDGIKKLFELDVIKGLKTAGAIICRSLDPNVIDWYLKEIHGSEEYQHFESPISAFWTRAQEDLEFTEDDRVAALERLLKEGVDPNATTVGGSSMIQLAAESGSRREVRVLLAYQADLHHRDDEGYSLLHYASDNPDTFFYLLEKGLDPHAVNNQNERVLSAFKDPEIDPNPWVQKLADLHPNHLKVLVEGCSLLSDKPDSELIWESPLVISALLCLPEYRQTLFQRWGHLVPHNPLDGMQHPAHLSWIAPLLGKLLKPEEQIEVLLQSPLSFFSEFLRFASKEQVTLLKPALVSQAMKLSASYSERALEIESAVKELEASLDRTLFDRLRGDIFGLRRQFRSLLNQSEWLAEGALKETLESHDQQLGEWLERVQACQGKIPCNKVEEVPEEVDIMLGLGRLFPSLKFDDESALGSRLYKVYEVGLCSLADLQTLGLCTGKALSQELREWAEIPATATDREAQQELLRRYLDQEGLSEVWSDLAIDTLLELWREHSDWTLVDFFQLKEKFKG